MSMIKVLSLMQPWAELVVNGAKAIETRSWPTRYRGELYIHASKKFFYSDLELYYQDHFFRKNLPDPKKLITGAIIGKVNLVNVVAVEELDGKLSKQERTFGDYTTGRFAWILESPQRLSQPIPAAGKLSIWEYEFQDIKEEVSHD